MDGPDLPSLDSGEKSKKKSLSVVTVTGVATAILFALILIFVAIEGEKKKSRPTPSASLTPPVKNAHKMNKALRATKPVATAAGSMQHSLEKSPRTTISEIHGESVVQKSDKRSDSPPKLDMIARVPENSVIPKDGDKNTEQEKAAAFGDLPKSDDKAIDSRKDHEHLERLDPVHQSTRGDIAKQSAKGGDSQNETEQKQTERVESGNDDLPKPEAKTGVCWYDGHCGVRELCAPTGQKGVGKCISLALGDEPPVNATQACADACVAELRLDEHHHHEMWANVESINSFTSGEYPNGCRVVFRREPQGDHFRELDHTDSNFRSTWTDPIKPSDKEWLAKRFKHVKRVDPISGPSEDGEARWMALCTNPCETDADCSSRVDGTAFHCRDGSCQKNPTYWGPSSLSRHPVTLVSAATGGYFRGLKNLAASARFWAPDHKMVVYNIGGFTSDMKAEIRSWSNVIALEWEDGVPDSFPSHVKRGKGYGWTPIVVNETLHKYGSIFFMDAGSTLAGKIDPVEAILEREGIFLAKGQDGDMKLSHPDTYKWFGYDKETFKTGPHYSGGTHAYLYPSRYVDTIVQANANCALDAKCINPMGSNLGNHRYDQTTLSILAYQPKIRPGHHVEYLASSRNQLNPDLTLPSFRFVWTARQGCSFYSNRESLEAEQQNATTTKLIPKKKGLETNVRKKSA